MPDAALLLRTRPPGVSLAESRAPGRHDRSRGQPVKGVAMKRFAFILCAALGLFLSHGKAEASWGALCYGGWQPCWNIFAHRAKCLTPEEERLQRFWHD